MLWFEKVRGGSMYVNHPERVQKHSAHVAYPVKRRFGTVEPPRTPVNEVYLPCTLCEGVEGSVQSNHPELRCGRLLHTLLAL